jgi:heme/copper-type cytochrome/quinol oxidase subunit 2
MNDKLLEQLAAKLGTTTEYLWHVLVEAQRINGVISLVELSIAIVFVIAAVKVFHYAWVYRSPENAGYGDDDWRMPVLAISGVVFTVALISVLVTLEWSLLEFTRPEYAALKEILSVLKPEK